MNNHLKHSRNELPHLEEGLGRGSIRSCFLPAKAGLLERPKAAFFTVAADGVMPRMTVGMVASTRRKPVSDSRHRHHRQGEAAILRHGFCINSITLIGAIKVEKHMIEPTQSAATKSRRSPARHQLRSGRPNITAWHHLLITLHPQANHPPTLQHLTPSQSSSSREPHQPLR